MRPVVLIIRDGWGVNDHHDGNAVAAAKTPVIDQIRARYPHCLLDCCGEAVGLPDGYQGSSEVGHLNMGAGRIVVQELKRIDDGLSSGELFQSPKWANLIANWKKNNSQLHFFGLLQDEGVHAHQEHLYKLMKRARQEFPEGRIVVHPFLDGRDTPPRSTLEYIARLKQELAAVGNATIGTAMGRYYGMDRSKNWKLTTEAYNCIVSCAGKKAATIEEAVKGEYEKGKTPDNTPMTDEYIPCYVIGDYAGMKDGDVVMHTNYRQDRAIQLTQAFVAADYPDKAGLKAQPKVTFLGFTRYWDEFEDYLLGAMGAGGGMDNLLGEVVSKAGFKQLRLAETQKIKHVTSFFNGKSTTPSAGEDQ
ncbi:MAG: 2,3-bisphosphoglycerate-independent phosphoglycerate mutase, partial [Kiritimatiellae bacterium]|nr:2,3-bisphosphoglycerate-independent phosphoglycerate mutase [Kiritimatiellia bacterium]